MAMIDIQHLSIYEFEKYANQIFSILYDNMTKILPSDVSREEDFACWSEAMKQLGSEIQFTEAYANKRNTKSLGILARLGLSIVEKDDTGMRCHLRGRYEDLVKWYERK